MYKKNTTGWLKHWDFMIWDFLLLQLSFWLAYVFRNGISNPYDNMLYRNTAVIIGLLDLCFGFFMGNYKGILRRDYWKEFQAVVRHVAAITLGVIVCLFVMKVSEQYSRLAMAYFPFIACVALYCGRVSLKYWLKSHNGPAIGKRRIVLLGEEKNYREMIDNFMNNPFSEFRVVGMALLNESAKCEEVYRGVPIITGEKAILEHIRSEWIDEILINLLKENNLADELIQQCAVMGITIHMNLVRLENGNVNQLIEKIEGYTVLSSSIMVATTGQIFLKRIMDIVGGLVGIVCTAIIALIIGPVIYIKDPGSIFFSQIRIGKNGRKIKIYKFRSMYKDAEKRKKELLQYNNVKSGLMFKMDDDPRIIKGIGHFIRKYSLDEFPQFWNVLKGEMSLVGTRPPTLDEWEKYEFHHRSRLATKPGITGMWQVSGRSAITDFEEVVRLDTKYIREWNLGLDIEILLKTILVILKKEGSM